ncbi:MAG: sulfate permease [Bacteroidota bacterium]
MWKKFFPAYDWLPGYTVKIFGNDAIAGITLAAYAIPVSLAYAMLAGLPPQYGVYGYLLGGLFYAMLGSGRQLAIGPTSAISLLIGTTIAGMAAGDPQRWADIASLTALVFACMSLIAYLLRLNGIINFISDTVLVGFKAGAALAIGLTQLPKLFGVPGGGESFFERLGALFNQLPQTNMTVFIFGISAMVILIAGEKLLPGRPVAILVVTISIILVTFTSLGNTGFTTAGILPTGLPHFHFPSIGVRDIEGIIPLAFACFLLAYIESISAAKAIARDNGYEIDPRQELLALGAANLATSLGQGYPVSGGLSQSAVNEKAGAKTPVSLVFASAVIALCLLFLTGLLKNLPNVILACVVLVAIRGLVDVKEFVHLWKMHRTDFFIAMIAVMGVLLFGILSGVLIAAVSTLLLMIKSVSDPHVAFLGRIPGTNRFTDLGRHPDNEKVPGVLIFRVESSLFYFNVENIRKDIWLKLQSPGTSIKTVICDLSTSPYVDRAGAAMLKRLYLELKAKGISFRIAEAHAQVRDMLRAEELEGLVGHISRKDSVDELVQVTMDRSEKSTLPEKCNKPAS